MSVGVVFGQMLVLLAMMVVGFFAYKKNWVTDETAGHFSKLVVNIFNPILVVNGVLGQNGADAGSNVVWNLAFIVGYFVILVILGYCMPLIVRPKQTYKNIYRIMTIFSNVGFMGIPVIKSIFGDGAMIYVAFYILGYNIMLYTCGMHLSRKAGEDNQSKGESYLETLAAYREGKYNMTEEQIVRSVLSQKEPSEKPSFFKRLMNPGVIAAFTAVIIFVTGIQMPGPIVTFCGYMGNTTIPLSMIMIGISIAQADLKEVFTDLRMYIFILLRMILLPVVMIFGLKGFVAANGVDPMVFGVFIIELGMPVGSIIVMLTRENGGDAAYCTRGVVLSTLASIVTIPVICAFL